MSLSRAHHRLVPALLLALATLVACSDDDPAAPAGDPLLATWNATSLTATGIPNLIAQGMSMSITFSSGGTYSMAVTNDLAELCAGPTNCTQTGTWSTSGSMITIDSSDGDPATFAYSFSGSVLTLTGDIEGTLVTFVFQKA